MVENKILADFMGIGHLYPCNTPIDTLEYHKSWDWLMPVVEKIERMNFEIDGVITSADVHIVYGDCRIVDEDGNGLFEFYSHSTDSGDKLGATYKAVVEFIEYYHKTQCNNCGDMMLMLDEECPDCGRTN